ncbi:MAG: hypothetical protein OEW19_09645 [Acidobacteriota bacterium]|nr:hypothetical protein [Acidobacteriota bacterium]
MAFNLGERVQDARLLVGGQRAVIFPDAPLVVGLFARDRRFVVALPRLEAAEIDKMREVDGGRFNT